MNKYLLCLLGGLVAAVAQAAEDRVFVLAPAGDVDPALVESVRARMEEMSGAVVNLAPAVPMQPGQSLETIGRTAATTLRTEDPGIIVLARPTDAQPQGVCLPDYRFAVLNVARLEVGADAALVTRRASQEGLRVMSMLVNMAPCPFPLCVLVGYDKVEDLDRMSGNFCPPCQDRFVRVAREAGIRLVEPQESALDPAPGAADETLPAGDDTPAPVAESEGVLL